MKNQLTDLLKPTSAMCLFSSNEVYFGIGRANEVAQWLHQNGRVISGFEGFTIDGRHICPLMNYIADLSELCQTPDALQQTYCTVCFIIAGCDSKN